MNFVTYLYRGNNFISLFGLFLMLVLPILKGCNTFSQDSNNRQDGPIHAMEQMFTQMGYKPNIGLKANLAPGAIIQVKGIDRNGKEIDFESPRVFMDGTDCYPGINVRINKVILPKVQVTQYNRVRFEAGFFDYYFPKVELNKDMMSGYAMEFSMPVSMYVPRGKFMDAMSRQCRKALHSAIKSGEPLNWFELVDEILLAEKASYHFYRASNHNPSEQTDQDKTEQLITDLTDANTSGSVAANMKRIDHTSHYIEMKWNAPIILAYKSRKLYQQSAH